MESDPLLACVPNFSEGRDEEVLAGIAAAIESVEGVTLLDVDPGIATNRTVFTFVGTPGAVVEAAVRAGSASAELIDMSRHHGEHPRFGGMDVCPLVPVRGLTMDDAAARARELAARLGSEAGLTVYCYGHAASTDARRDLAAVRAGEYEGLPARLAGPDWAPDFGPAEFNARSGATAVGARDFLIAYNVNLNTTSVRRANSVAFDVRERGRIKREGDPVTGEIVTDAAGEPVWEPGTLRAAKAIGWYIEEYGIAQVSMNLTNISVTPMHTAFDEVSARAADRGMRVTGSELVGLVPLRAMLEAGRHYLARQRRSTGVSDEELVHIAIKSLGLDDLRPFDPHQKIIEWRLRRDAGPGLVDRTVAGFTVETAAESPAPGGGSVAALAGALGAALGAMVANLAAQKRGWEARIDEFSGWAARAQTCRTALLDLVDADTRAFEQVLAAYRLPAGDDPAARDEAIQAAIRGAIAVPLEVMRISVEALEVAAAMAESGPETAVSDTGVGALMASAAVRGAHLNVRINAADLADPAEADHYLTEARELEAGAGTLEAGVLARVRERIAD
jgi:glutamate formiminotransferase/formiminotetrahydrofolate cyclodeaminase